MFTLEIASFIKIWPHHTIHTQALHVASSSCYLHVIAVERVDTQQAITQATLAGVGKHGSCYKSQKQVCIIKNVVRVRHSKCH